MQVSLSPPPAPRYYNAQLSDRKGRLGFRELRHVLRATRLRRLSGSQVYGVLPVGQQKEQLLQQNTISLSSCMLIIIALDFAALAGQGQRHSQKP